jgi:hypothetical protein
MLQEQIQVLWNDMQGTLDESGRRLFAASLAKVCGHGGATLVHKATGIALNTITRGKRELETPPELDAGRVREVGGGPKWTEEKYPLVQEHIRKIIDDATYGDPMRLISYTTESLRKIEKTLMEQYNEPVSHTTIGDILEDMGYSKQGNQKMLQPGKPHPDRNAQFEFINEQAKAFIAAGEPVISVDTKKKENIGNFRNSGQEYRRKHDPREVLDHDFPIEELGKIAPYGIFCQNDNTGFMNVGTSHDTADFAVESISRWWNCVGKHTFPNATKLLITCNCGGRNGYRNRLWKYRLSQLSELTGLEIHVCHFPPGTSKWNKVEHRLFCYISKSRQGKPLVSVETAVNLIGSTTTRTGLKVICQRDDTVYELAQSVSDEDFEAINIDKIPPRETWNYLFGKSNFASYYFTVP